ncbi:MAG: hypothetical protein ACQESN_10635 [Thermotogota bacterium]
MLNDIVYTTEFVFNQFIPKNKPTRAKKAIYDLYRAMQELLDGVNLVSEHYLALNFYEPYLQGSQHGCT